MYLCKLKKLQDLLKFRANSRYYLESGWSWRLGWTTWRRCQTFRSAQKLLLGDFLLRTLRSRNLFLLCESAEYELRQRHLLAKQFINHTAARNGVQKKHFDRKLKIIHITRISQLKASNLIQRLPSIYILRKYMSKLGQWIVDSIYFTVFILLASVVCNSFTIL